MRQSAAACFHVTCRDCSRVVVTVPRIGDAELARLREHVRRLHPREALPADAGVAETLKHFLVEQAAGTAGNTLRRGFRRICRAAEVAAEVGLDWLGRALLVLALVACCLIVGHFLGIAGWYFLHDLVRCDDDDR